MNGPIWNHAPRPNNRAFMMHDPRQVLPLSAERGPAGDPETRD